MSWIPTLCLAVFCCSLTLATYAPPIDGKFAFSILGDVATPPVEEKFHSALLGAEECLDGPSYWCHNFTSARQCNATKHCIRTVWENQVLPADNGEICETCKKMVAQARDELQSNETQENIKLVLEGSCAILVHPKPLAKECMKLVDQAIPELIEALSSQMNPQVVCATAGLCNSARMDKLAAMYKAKESQKLQLNCDNCPVLTGMIDRNFRAADRDHVLNSMLEVCGQLGSFSDACSATIIVHFNNIYEKIAADFTPGGLCHLSGICRQRYHNHSKEVEVKPVPKLEGDMPCQLCEQLVQHLRDVLIANTTEKEFEMVLLGICKQTRPQYQKECVSLVETYLPAIYIFLTEELDGKAVCTSVGLCPKTNSEVYPLYPLLPVQVASTLEKTSSGLHKVSLATSGVSVHSASAVLPLDSLILIPQDKNLCQMCQYFLHFLQIEITDPKNEQEMIAEAEKACKTLPNQYTSLCKQFIDSYSNAVFALLAQDIDPSQVCPRIGVCPGVELFSNIPRCEPCKASTSRLISNLRSNHSVANIKKEMKTMCLGMEDFETSQHCSQVVLGHHEDLVDMALTEFTDQEMCFFMKYCPDELPKLEGAAIVGGNVETNDVSQTQQVGTDLCTLCEFVIKTVEQKIQNNKTEEAIRETVEHVCEFMPRTTRAKCRRFVDQYCDLIVTLLAQSADPQEVCSMINLCINGGINFHSAIEKPISKCVVCESLMGALQGVLEDPDLHTDFNHKLEMACLQLPHNMGAECQDIVRQLAPQIESILTEIPVGMLVCRRLLLCGHTQTVEMISPDRCADEKYWCLSTVHAATCEKIEHCQKNVWFAEKPNHNIPKIRAKKFIF